MANCRRVEKKRSAIIFYRIKFGGIFFITLISIFLWSFELRAGSSLSDVMEKSSDDYKGERTVSDPVSSGSDSGKSSSCLGSILNIFSSSDTDSRSYNEEFPEDQDEIFTTVEDGSEVEQHDDTVVEDAVSPDGEENASTIGTEENIDDSESTEDDDFDESGPLFSANFGIGAIKGEDFHEMVQLNLAMGRYYSDFQRGEIFIGGGSASIQETSKLDMSISDGVFIYDIGYCHKFFTTPRYTFLGQYFILGASLDLMQWSYKNTVTTESGKEISSDNIMGFEIFTGIGFHLIQTNHFQIGAEVVPGIIFWTSNTKEGFSNDVFDPLAFVKFRMTISKL